jgi:hypothetical protein
MVSPLRGEHVDQEVVCLFYDGEEVIKEKKGMKFRKKD